MQRAFPIFALLTTLALGSSACLDAEGPIDERTTADVPEDDNDDPDEPDGPDDPDPGPSDNGPDGDHGESVGDPDPLIDPAPGTWVYSETLVADNDCHFLDPPTRGLGKFTLAPGDEDRQFTIDTGIAGETPYTCTLDDNNWFHCPERVDGQHVVSGLDAMITVYLAVNAEVVADGYMSGTLDGASGCHGTTCWAASQYLQTELPCTFTVEFEAFAVSYD